MKIQLVAIGREFLHDGLAVLLAQTRLALLHEKKAFLPISKTEKAIELVQEAAKTIPAHDDGKEREWEIPGELLPVYRDSLVILGFQLEQLRKKEVEMKVSPDKTKKKMDQVQSILKELGDQRDLFQLVEEQNRKQERAAKGSQPDPAQQDLLQPGPADGDGVDGKGNPPPKATEVTPLRPRLDRSERAAASPAPAE